MGGRSIFRARAGDPNLNVILETLTDGGRHLAMAQRYLPEIAHGDKRILLVDGEPVDYCLARIPQGDEFRGNLAAGGRGEGRPLTERDRWIAAPGRPGDEAPRHAVRRPGRDRRLPDRSQRHQPDLHPRTGRAVRPEHRRPAVRRASKPLARTRTERIAPTDVRRRRTAVRRSANANASARPWCCRCCCTACCCSGLGFALEDAAPVLPTLDVILTQTADRADAEAGRFPRPGQQPGRRRKRQGQPAARHPERPGAASPTTASRRANCARSRPRRSRRRKRASSAARAATTPRRSREATPQAEPIAVAAGPA